MFQVRSTFFECTSIHNKSLLRSKRQYVRRNELPRFYRREMEILLYLTAVVRSTLHIKYFNFTTSLQSFSLEEKATGQKP